MRTLVVVTQTAVVHQREIWVDDILFLLFVCLWYLCVITYLWCLTETINFGINVWYSFQNDIFIINIVLSCIPNYTCLARKTHTKKGLIVYTICLASSLSYENTKKVSDCKTTFSSELTSCVGLTHLFIDWKH